MVEPTDQPRQHERLTGLSPAFISGMSRRRALYLVVGAAAAGAAALTGCSSDEPSASDDSDLSSNTSQRTEGADAVVYASPSCGCCGQYADYLGSEGGYTVDLQRTEDVDSIKTDAGVPEDAAGCHTTMIGDYVVEGHVPLEAIDKLLQQRPAVNGIALPGMPAGSPGMGGAKEAPFEILSFADGTVEPFTTV